MSKNRRSRLVFFILLTFALTIFIFANSLKAGDESSAQSNFITDWVNRLLTLFGIQADFRALSHFVRKLAHFSEYFVLGLTSSAALSQLNKRVFITLSPIYCAMIAVCDEFVMQAITEGRAPMWTDVLIDSAGAITAFIIVLAVLLIRKEHRNEE